MVQVGVQIGNHVGNKDLDDEGLITFLQVREVSQLSCRPQRPTPRVALLCSDVFLCVSFSLLSLPVVVVGGGAVHMTFYAQHCAEKDIPVLVHPWDMDMMSGRLEKYMMGWTVGMPLETHLSIVVSLAYVLKRATLKEVVPHIGQSAFLLATLCPLRTCLTALVPPACRQ